LRIAQKIRELIFPPEVSWHVSFIAHLAEVLKVKNYLEIGIYEAETFNKISSDSRFAVDINPLSFEYIEDSTGVTCIPGKSKDFAEYFEKFCPLLSIDLAFIDGDHQKFSVITDFENIHKKISRGGVVLFHDTHPKTEEYSSENFCGDAYAAIPELRMRFTEWSFASLPIHPGLVIATRNDNFPEWLDSKLGN
jgi:Methyltransferase domain